MVRLPTRWRQGREAVEAVMVRAVLRGLEKLGPASASDLLGNLFRRLGPVLPVTRVAESNLRAVFPERDADWRRATIHDMWESLGRTAGEFPHIAALPCDSAAGPGWEVAGEEILATQAACCGPVIFVSGHIGNWELLPAAVAAYDLAFASVYRPASNAAVNDIVLGLRRRVMRQDIPIFQKGAAGARDALGHLRRGGRLGMLVDQKMNDGIQAQLFGLPAMTATAAAALALRFRCPIIPGHVERLGPARLRLVVDPPLTLTNSGDRQADIQALTQAINDCLERWIRAQPSSWLWLHRRFPKDVVLQCVR